MKLNVLIAFERSGKVREAFRRLGHNAWSNDLEPADDGSPYHIQGDAAAAMKINPMRSDHMCKYDLIIQHNPCTALACSGNRWYGKGQPLHHMRVQAIKDTMASFALAKSRAHHVALENPVGVLPMKASQYIQPWMFGHGETKRTGLWLHNLPTLTPTDIVEGRDQKVWKMPPSEERARLRSETYQGIADAMAHQWSFAIQMQRAEATRHARG